MTVQNKIIAVVTSVVVAALIVLGISLRWTVWITVLAVVVSCAVAVLAVVIRRAPAPVPQQPVYVPLPPAPAPQQPVQAVAVQGVNLASAWPDYEFIFDVAVYWRLVDDVAAPTAHVRPGAVAIDMIIRRAAEVAALEEPGMAVRLQHRLNDVLGRVEGDRSGRILVWADQVRTTLSDHDQERLRRLADIRKDKAVWEHTRNYESDRREYLTNDVLKSTGSAVVWWLSRNEANVVGAVDLIGTMARLSAAAKNEDVAELFRHLLPPSALPEREPNGYPTVDPDGLASMNGGRSAANLVTGLMDAMHLDRDEQALFAERVAMDITAMGHEDVARQIREQFDVITEQFTDDRNSEPVSATEADEDTMPEADD